MAKSDYRELDVWYGNTLANGVYLVRSLDVYLAHIALCGRNIRNMQTIMPNYVHEVVVFFDNSIETVSCYICITMVMAGIWIVIKTFQLS